MKCWSCGATSWGQTNPSLPIVMAADVKTQQNASGHLLVCQENLCASLIVCVRTCVFQQSFGCVGSVDDLHQVREHHANVRLHLCTYTEEEEQRRQVKTTGTTTTKKIVCNNNGFMNFYKTLIFISYRYKSKYKCIRKKSNTVSKQTRKKLSYKTRNSTLN